MLCFLLVSMHLVYADTNGIWHNVEDIRGGVFGLNEQDIVSNFTFINPVYFLGKLLGKNSIYYINLSGKSKLNSVESDMFCLGANCIDNWSNVGGEASLSAPPVCNGDNALQWDGNDWLCNAFVTPCVSKASFSCYAGNVYWYDSCGDREELKESCISGCSGISCDPVCTSHASSACYSGDVYWYDSCGARENRKESCSYGCAVYNGVPECVQTKVVRRCYSSGKADHLMTDSSCPAGYIDEGPSRIPSKKYPGTYEMVSCLNSVNYDHMTTNGHSNCPTYLGYYYDDFLGYPFTVGNLPTGVSANLVYRCWYQQSGYDMDHFINPGGCASYNLDGDMGYFFNY